MTVDSIDPSTGGPARSVPCLGNAIHKAGEKVCLYVNNKEGKRQNSMVLQQNSLPINPISKLAANIQTISKEKNRNILLHNHGIWLPLNHRTAIVARDFAVPLIISPRGMLEPWARRYQNFKKTIAWYLYQLRDLKTASLLHATSMQEAENLHTLGLKIPIAVIPNGVDISHNIKCTLKPKDKKTILFLSRIHPKKGLINLVHAWSDIRPNGWRILIAGPDESNHQQEVEKEISRLNLAKSVSFIGSVTDSDKWALYNEADLFVLPTFSENFGIVVAEALASGLPVITTKGAPWSELHRHNCGWWIDIGVDPLAQAISEATSLSAEQRFEMGQRGKTVIADKYSWNTIAKDMISVYEWILHGGTIPPCIFID